jgi:hypothetical protein
MSSQVFERSQRRHGRLALILSLGGVAFTLVQLVIGTQAGIFPIPGRDVLIWDRVGDAIWTGGAVYDHANVPTDSFVYAPPIAVVFSLVSWLPAEIQHGLFMLVRVLSLRVIAGSWLGAGIACWFPLVAFDLGGGNFNLLVAAAIVAAVSGRPHLAVWAGLAKLGPLLAIHPRDWRPTVAMLGIALLVTLPWLQLWWDWARLVVVDIGAVGLLGPQVPLPWIVRLAAAAALLLVVRSPWARALAATLAIPAFYWGSLVVLLAPAAVIIRERLAREAPAEPTSPALTFQPGAGQP